MKRVNHEDKSAHVKVEPSLDKYENYPLPDYKTESAKRNLESALEVVRKLREKTGTDKSNNPSKET